MPLIACYFSSGSPTLFMIRLNCMPLEAQSTDVGATCSRDQAGSSSGQFLWIQLFDVTANQHARGIVEVVVFRRGSDLIRCDD
jgi:hypothetical protein